MVMESIKAAGEAEVDMITDLVNQSIIEELIPAEWKLSNVVNCNKEKGNAIERGDYRGLKLIGQILMVTQRNIERLIKQLMGIDQTQSSFMSDCKATNANFILRQLQDNILGKTVIFIIGLERSFDQVPSYVAQ